METPSPNSWLSRNFARAASGAVGRGSVHVKVCRKSVETVENRKFSNR